MTDALKRPPKRNPVLPLRLPTLAAGRTQQSSHSGCPLPARRAASNCRSVTIAARSSIRHAMPAQHVCPSRLEWTPVDGRGELISDTLLHHSNELYFRQLVPLRLGLVRLNRRTSLFCAHLHGDCPHATAPVRVRAHLDKSGQAVLIALPANDTPNMADDRILREMTSDPKFRKVLITDAKSATGQALCKRFLRCWRRHDLGRYRRAVETGARLRRHHQTCRT